MLTLMKNKQNKEALKELVYFQGRGQQLLEMLALEASCGAEVLVLCRAAPVCEAKISALCLYLDTPDSRQRHTPPRVSGLGLELQF